MTQRRWLQAGGVGGIVSVVLLLVAVLWPRGALEPQFDSPASEWLAYASGTQGVIIALHTVEMVGLFGFSLFAVGLALRLGLSGERTSAPSILVVLAAGLTMTLWLGAFSAELATAFRARELDATTVGVLSGLANALFASSWFAIAGLLLSASVGALASRALPRWLTWSGLVVGCALLVTAAAPLTQLYIVPYLLFFVWVVVISVLLVRSRASLERERH